MGHVKDGGDTKILCEGYWIELSLSLQHQAFKAPASVVSFQKKTLLWSVCGVENEENEGYLFDGEERFWETDDGKWAVSDEHVESLTL